MVTRRALEQAIHALEDQSVLPEAVQQLALKALRDKLAAMQTGPFGQQQAEVCVLVADLSGFTSLSEFRDAEEVRDMINGVWQKLDQVIASWGGLVDKHVGDGVIALFGGANTDEDDAERAIQAALDMHLELALFNEALLRRPNGHMPARDELRMRIGIHIGQVMFGLVGSRGEQTAVGDAVTIANELEKRAPVGGVLVSQEVLTRARPYFEVTEQETAVLAERETAVKSYSIVREKPQLFRRAQRRSPYTETRLVGRVEEVTRLQELLQMTIERGRSRVITVMGEAGIGKTRLLYEFQRLMAVMPEDVVVFHGTLADSPAQRPYAMVRSLLVNHFDIRRRNSPGVAREVAAWPDGSAGG